MTKIDVAVEPLRAAACEIAIAQANKIINNVKKKMEEVGNDLQKCAPFPNSIRMSKLDYISALNKYKLYRALTKNISGSRKMDDPEIAEIDPERCARFIEESRKAAEAQFVAYARKLNQKIGEVTEATLSSNNEKTGENLWHFSELDVVLVNGEKQKWRTRLVHAVSKLGNPFVRFPTRLIKT